MVSSVKVVLYESKTLKNGEHPIMLRLTKDRKTKYISLNASCSKDQWNYQESVPKPKHPLHRELVNKINKKKLEASKLLLSLDNDEKDFSAELLQGKLKTKAKAKRTVLQYFDDVIAKLEKANRIGYANIFTSTKNSLVKFRDKKDFEFSDVTMNFITNYEEDFYSRGCVMNSVFVHLRTFKTLINYAKKDEIVRPEYDPFKNINFTKFRRIKTAKRAISKADMQLIIKMDLEPNSSLYDAKNYFLFSFYNRGINFVDIAFLKWENITKDRLSYVRRKTKESFSIGLLEPAKEILKYYKQQPFYNKDGFIFPILSDDYLTATARSIDNRLDRILKIVNGDLKIIGEKAEIETKLTTYVARHSYATILKRSGISTSIISEAMGHESEKTTQIYLDSFGNYELDEASKMIL
jgi:site-specific recombinase XerD